MRRLVPPKHRKLRAAEIRALLAETEHVPDLALSKTAMARVYALADGRALTVYEHGRGILYESHAELAAWVTAVVERARAPSQTWTELFPDGEHFEARVAELIRHAPTVFGLEAGALDLSVESLDRVDRSIRRMGRVRVLTPDVFPVVTAYVGEVIRLAIGGRWRVRAGSQGWEPDVLDAAGHACTLLGIYKEILEYDRKVSLRAFANVKIRNHRRDI